jgi:RNA polymerase sigma-70 factor (ECF subfamily)
MSGGDVHRWQSALGSRLRSGERQALLELYDQMGSFVYGVALRITGSPDVAARITQDVFLHVWARPQELDGYGTRIRTRLAVLTHGRAVAWVRQERAAAIDAAEVADAGGGELDRFSDAEELADALATAGRVQGALAGLSPEQRLALELTYFGGNTYEAAAGILGLPAPVVAAQVSAALHGVSRLLGRGAAEPGRSEGVDGVEVRLRDHAVEGGDPDGAR